MATVLELMATRWSHSCCIGWAAWVGYCNRDTFLAWLCFHMHPVLEYMRARVASITTNSLRGKRVLRKQACLMMVMAVAAAAKTVVVDAGYNTADGFQH